MEGYLGETIMDVKDTPYKDFGREEWMMYYLENYGGFDGSHHKDWVFDQMARIHHGTPVEVKLAKWSNGTEEYRVNTLEASEQYNNWVIEMKNGEDGPDTYGYETGVAP